jgi:hypothetical protein
MKSFLTIVVAGSAPLVLAYLGVSFVMWELNPANWPEGARFVTVIIGLTPMFVFDYERTFR